MRSAHFLIGAALAWLSAAAASAAETSGEVGIVSDYRYRGVSLSRGRPAIQGTLTVEHGPGHYAELWGSTLGSGNPADVELDLTAGYERALSDKLGVALSATYFCYPRSGSDNYFEASASANMTVSQIEVGLELSFAPVQRGTGGKPNLYFGSSAEYQLPATPLTLKASLGQERGAFDEVAHGAKWDWSFGGEVKAAPLRIGLAYVGSNSDRGDRHSVVASAFLEW